MARPLRLKISTQPDRETKTSLKSGEGLVNFGIYIAENKSAVHTELQSVSTT